jgi:hypothetical protein
VSNSLDVIRATADAFNRDGVEGLIRYRDPAIAWHTTARFVDRSVPARGSSQGQAVTTSVVIDTARSSASRTGERDSAR